MALAFRLPQVIPSGDRAPLRLVEQTKRGGVRVVLVASILMTAMFGVVVLRTTMAQQQMRIDRLNSDIIRARNNFDKLRAERARFQSPEYLIDRAKALGMVPSIETVMVEIPADIAVEVAAGVGKVDSDVVASRASQLDEFGRMKRTVTAP